MTELDKNFLFKPAKVGLASEDIALQIESAIMSETLKPGDGLPSERELQTQFATGRGVIREAIQALKQKGLIEIRKGKTGGAYVKHIDVKNISESLALFLKQSHVSTDKVAEFRESVDHQIALLAMTRATDQQKQKLIELIEQLELAGKDENINLNLLGEIDRALNIQIARMADNPIFDWVINALQQGFSSHDFRLYQNDEFRRLTIQNWRTTVNHLLNSEPLKIQSSISFHYQLLSQCIEK
ncbi:FadR/GntR family transcriptional regulator [Vibrio viridaestus]|uniref:FadR family transcriptional regulator n=1 Tax=Vibrio viridaestus TaxID=2487322 RepID=A0A3N9TLS1_9VIBR|nr:GntR family transcriptional regulator [Vibrio viridaestus]RQW64565.1 FadR family transcriptional regulator [Vibrio viridaestus]